MTRTQIFNDRSLFLPARFKFYPPGTGSAGNARRRAAAIYLSANASASWPSGMVYELFYPTLVYDFFRTFQQRSVPGHPYWTGSPAVPLMPQEEDPSPVDVLFPDSDAGYDFSAPYSPDERSIYNLEFRRTGMLEWVRRMGAFAEAIARIRHFQWIPATSGISWDPAMHARKDTKKALYRVNRRMRDEPDLKAFVESNPHVLAAASAMDSAIAGLAGQFGISTLGPATSVPGNRFPVAWRWWSGELKFDFDPNLYGYVIGGIAYVKFQNTFREAAHEFRKKVSAAMDAYDAAQEASGT